MDLLIVWLLGTVGFDNAVKTEGEGHALLKCFKTFIVELKGKTV